MARRSGGRRARKAERAAPLAEAVKPVRPGQTGGRFQPLSADGVLAIADNAFRILDQVGFADATPHCIETCTAAGAVLGDDGRLRMPRSLVERTLQQARRNLVLHGQDPRWDLHMSGTGCTSPPRAGVMVPTRRTGSPGTHRRRICTHGADRGHLRAHSHVPTHLRAPGHRRTYALDINTLYCSVMGTAKHVGSSWTVYQHLEKSFEMLHMIAGGRAESDLAGAPLGQPVQLLRGGPAAQVRRRCPRVPGVGGAGRHAGACCVPQPQAGATAPPTWPGRSPQAWAAVPAGWLT